MPNPTSSDNSKNFYDSESKKAFMQSQDPFYLVECLEKATKKLLKIMDDEIKESMRIQTHHNTCNADLTDSCGTNLDNLPILKQQNLSKAEDYRFFHSSNESLSSSSLQSSLNSSSDHTDNQTSYDASSEESSYYNSSNEFDDSYISKEIDSLVNSHNIYLSPPPIYNSLDESKFLHKIGDYLNLLKLIAAKGSFKPNYGMIETANTNEILSKESQIEEFYDDQYSTNYHSGPYLIESQNPYNSHLFYINHVPRWWYDNQTGVIYYSEEEYLLPVTGYAHTHQNII